MRIRLGYAMEFVVVLAVGMGLARFVWVVYGKDAETLLDRLQIFIVPFLVGIGLAGGLGTWLEAARRRSPPIWGVGRWAWSVSALCVLLKVLDLSVNLLFSHWRGNDAIHELGMVGDLMILLFARETWWISTAAWLTSLIIRQPRDPSPDAREWAGHFYLAALVAYGIASQIIDLAYRSR